MIRLILSCLFSMTLLCFSPMGLARELPVIGPVYGIGEPDLLQQIQQKLQQLQRTGEIKALQSKMKQHLKSTVNAPPPVVGLHTVTKRRVYTFDPSITLRQDIRDDDGRLIAKAGTVVNPLDKVSLKKPLLFFDGSSKAQRTYALHQYQQAKGKLVLILTKGRILDMMKSWNIRLYFDQGGRLTQRFGIKAVPAQVEQQGKVLTVTEVPVS